MPAGLACQGGGPGRVLRLLPFGPEGPCTRFRHVIMSRPLLLVTGGEGMRQLLLVLGLCLPIGVASAQTFGEITGQVTDQSGAVVTGVSITATNTATNASRATRTNASGIYSFPAMSPGAYQLKVEATGFQPM